MRINTLFTPLLRFIGLATITSLLTTLTAFDLYPYAFESQARCDKHAVSRWKVELADRDPFEDAEAVLNETERFVQLCPNRPEVKMARALAGILATRIGEPKRALTHFEKGAPLLQTHAKFAKIISLLAIDEVATAWAFRDKLIADWLAKAETDLQADIQHLKVDAGDIYHVVFPVAETHTGVKIVWLAVPEGSGWPAAISAGVKRDMTRIRLIANTAQDRANYIDFYRCRARRTLGQSGPSAHPHKTHLQATTLLQAYLRAPDQFSPSVPGEPLKGCYWPDRLLPHSSF